MAAVAPELLRSLLRRELLARVLGSEFGASFDSVAWLRSGDGMY